MATIVSVNISVEKGTPPNNPSPRFVLISKACRAMPMQDTGTARSAFCRAN